jgi:hypothetical protein
VDSTALHHEGSNTMKIGFSCVGIGRAAKRELIALIARSTEPCGQLTPWAPEHIVVVSRDAVRKRRLSVMAIPSGHVVSVGESR